MKRIPAYIVPTTHWDREWVMTLGQYRARLGDMLDKALELVEKKYPGYLFMLDGQSIVLSDYLDIRPENRERLTAALKEGTLVAGPWYVLADQELESYEATVRNLHYGCELVEQLGGKPMMEGYVPDSFGCMAALPQILNEFGIESANFSHSNPGFEKTECRWYAPDGSNVVCAAHGYGSGLDLSYADVWKDIFSERGREVDRERAMAFFMKEADRQLSCAVAPVVYFSSGLDHMEPREVLIDVVNYINAHQDKYELIYGTIEDYMREVAKYPLPRYDGEMRGKPDRKNSDNLNGTLTSRMDTKIPNLECERMLQYHLEPLWTAVSAKGLKKYPKGYLDKLWKDIIACHPHDSICGCSLDEVHADMIARMKEIIRTGDYLRDEAIRILAEALQAGGPEGSVPIMVFRGGGAKGNCLVNDLVRIPKRFKYDSYRLVDEAGNKIPCRAEWLCNKNKDLESCYMTKKLMAQVLSKSAPDDREDDEVFTLVRLTFLAENVPAVGWKCWYLLPGEQNFAAMEANENTLRNAHTEVTLNADGTFDITDLATGKRAKGLHKFFDRIESGNGYAHHEPENPEEIVGMCADGWKIVRNDMMESRAEAHIRIGDRSEVTLGVSLFRDCPEVRVSLHINNLKGDHCLRAQLPVEGTTIAFDHGVCLDDRPPYRGLEWIEHPFTDYIQRGNLTLFQGTVTAYEDDYIELLRCTSRLGPAAGADHPTPEGAMIGELCHEYALRVGCETPLADATAYHAACVVEAGKAREKGILPHTETLASIEGGTDMPVVSLKPAWDGNGIIVRAFNPGKAASVSVKGSFAGDSVICTNLAEKAAEAFDAANVPAKAFAPLSVRM